MSRAAIFMDGRKKRGILLVLSLSLFLAIIGSSDLYGKNLFHEKNGFLILAPNPTHAFWKGKHTK